MRGVYLRVSHPLNSSDSVKTMFLSPVEIVTDSHRKGHNTGQCVHLPGWSHCTAMVVTFA